MRREIQQHPDYALFQSALPVAGERCASRLTCWETDEKHPYCADVCVKDVVSRFHGGVVRVLYRKINCLIGAPTCWRIAGRSGFAQGACYTTSGPSKSVERKQPCWRSEEHTSELQS